MVLLGAVALSIFLGDFVDAAVGVVVSQVLIVLQWPDAKAGTLANLVIAVALAAAARRE